MAEPLDELEIKISSSSTDAVKKVNDLVDALDRLKKAASLEGVENTADKINSIGKAGKRLKVTVDNSTVTAIDNLIGKVKALKSAIEQVNGTHIKVKSATGSGKVKSGDAKAEDDIRKKADVAKVDASIEKTKTAIDSLKEKYEALERIQGKGGKDTQARNAAELAKISALLHEQEALYDSLIEKKNKYASSGAGGEVKASETTEVQSPSIENVTKRVGILQRAFSTFRRSVSYFSAETLKATKEGTASLNSMKKELFTHATIWGKIKDTAKGALDNIKTHLAASAVNSKLLNSFWKVAVPALGTLGTGFKKLGSGLKSIGKGVLNYITNPFKQALGVVNKWKAALTRVAFYRLVRTAIKMVTQGFQEGINNLYNFSSLVGTQFAPTMDALATSSLYLKNSLGAMAAPLIQAVAPAVTYLIDLFVSLLNVVNMLFSVLSGRTYTKAMKTSAKYADDLDKSLGGGAASAKELQRYLIGIDQLTIMPDEPNKGGGGGGGSDLGAQYEEMFEEVPLPDWVLNIKDAINQGDWTGAGELLAEKINSVIAGVDFEELGRKLGGVIQNAISFALGFVREMDWIAIGIDFASFLNGLFDRIDPNDLGALIASKINIAFELAYGLVTEFEWDEFGTWLGGVVNGWAEEIDVEAVAGAISGALKGAFELITTFFTTADFEEIGRKIGELLASVDWAGIFSGLLSAGGAIFNGLLDTVSGVAAGLGGGTNQSAKGSGSIVTGTNLPINSVDVQRGKNSGGLSPEGILESIVLCLNSIAGTMVGFKAGGPKGAVIGAAISAGITANVNSVMFNNDGTLSFREMTKGIEYIFTALGLAVSGWIVGGPVGAVVGLTLGVVLNLAVLSTEWKNKNNLLHQREELTDMQMEYDRAVAAGEIEPDQFGKNAIEKAQEKYWSQYDVDQNLFKESSAKGSGSLLNNELPLYLLHGNQNIPKSKIDLILDAETTKNFDEAAGTYKSIKNKKRQLDLNAKVRNRKELQDVDDKWKTINNKSVTLSAMAKNINSGVLSGIQSVWSTIKDKTATIVGSGEKSQSLVDLQSSYDNIKNKDATVTGKGVVDASVSTVIKNFGSIGNKSATLSAYATNNNPSVLSALKTAWNTIVTKTAKLTANIAGTVSGFLATLAGGKATGGIFAGGTWHDIAGYAGGGSPRRARLFYANENGIPELIGSIGGNTAVMNNGQIVASVSSGVYRAVSAAMGGVGSYFGSIATSMNRIPEVLSNIVSVQPQPIMVGANGPSYEMDMSVVGGAGRDGYTQRGEEDQEEIINAIYAMGQRIISAINTKDTSLYFDTQKVGSSTTEVQNRQNRMYGKALSNG